LKATSFSAGPIRFKDLPNICAEKSWLAEISPIKGSTWLNTKSRGLRQSTLAKS
jgi:hypothetical protein